MNTKRIIIPTILIIGMVLLTIGPAAGAARTFTGLIYWSNGTQCMTLDGTPGNTLDITSNVTLVTYNQSTIIPVDVTVVPGRYTLVLDDPNDMGPGDGFDYYTVSTDGSKVETNTTHSTYWVAPGVIGFDIHLDPPADQPDLIVEDITPSGTITNFGSGNVYGLFFANESNDICAKITNIDTGDAGPFTVEFNVSGTLYTTNVPGLGAGNNTTVCITDTLPRPAGSVTIDVEADSTGAVAESNESNNTNSWSGDILNNGYKGKKDYTGGSDIDTYKCFCVNGGVNYSAGDSYYLSSSTYPDWTNYVVTWSNGNPLPPGTTLVEARLYVPYCWAAYDFDVLTQTSMTFNGNSVPQDMCCSSPDDYWDAKLYDPLSSFYGTLVYNVTEDYNTSGNTADLGNTYLGGDNMSVRGMILVVVYDDGGDTRRNVILNEGFDMLCAYPERYATTSVEATAWAPFDCPSNCCLQAAGARLITFAPGAGGSSGAGEGELIFNGQVWNDAWVDNDAHQIGISDVDVTSYLQSTNEAGFQSNSATHDWMEAMVGILEIECSGAVIAIDQPEFVDPQCQFTINITVDPLGCNISAVQYDLYYNTSVVWAEWANPGPFLGQDGADTHVEVREIDNTWDVPNHVGRITYAETTLASGGSGDLPYVTDPGVLTTIHFSAIGVRGTYSYMDIRDALASDEKKDPVELAMEDCGVNIYDNQDPVANGTSMYRFSNVASKFQCFAVLCPCLSDGGDDLPGWGENITYVRWDFGDGEYGTSEGVDPCEVKMHEYTSWNWIGDDASGHYDPFIAYLTVRDDGEPQLSNTTSVEVLVYIAGDTNGDGVVDILDAACVGKHYDQTANPAPANCTPYWTDPQADEADLNNDNRVSTIDLMIVGTNWNHLAYAPYIQD